MTASRASSLRLPIPKAPIAATEMLAPATAARDFDHAGLQRVWPGRMVVSLALVQRCGLRGRPVVAAAFG
jgi:hypothetical protein